MQLFEKLEKMSDKLERKLNPGRELKMVPATDPILSRRAIPYTGDVVTDTALQQFVVDMIYTMSKHRAAGLAACQVGSPLALILVYSEEGPVVMLNPVITNLSESKTYEREGCLTYPGLFVSLWRSTEVTVQYLDLDGKTQTLTASGLTARAIQHEVDHVQGVVFIDKMPKVQRSQVGKKLERVRRRIAKNAKSLNRQK
jgi:peptide deformylase